MMLRQTLLRTSAGLRNGGGSVLGKRLPTHTTTTTSSATRVASFSTRFSFAPTNVTRSAVKPGTESEATTPGAGSTEEIAHSEGAYSGSAPSPSQSANQIESETNNSTDFSSSSANQETSKMATQKRHSSDQKPSKQQQEIPSKTDFGGTEARKQGGRGGKGSSEA